MLVGSVLVALQEEVMLTLKKAVTSVASVTIFLLLLGAKPGSGPGPVASNIARTGDTVFMMVSKSEPDTIINASDVTVSVTDSGGATFNVTLRHLLRLSFDETSRYLFRSSRADGWPSPAPPETQHESYQGSWLAIIDLIDPVTGDPVPVADGSATLSFSSPAITSRSIEIEILAGEGAPNPIDDAGTGGLFGYSDFTPFASLEPMPQLLVSVSGDATEFIGSATFVFKYVRANFENSNSAPKAVIRSPDSNVQLATHAKDVGGGVTQLTVIVMNPYGFKSDDAADAALAGGSSLKRDLRVALVWDEGVTTITESNWSNSIWYVESRFSNLNGEPVNGLQPNIIGFFP